MSDFPVLQQVSLFLRRRLFNGLNRADGLPTSLRNRFNLEGSVSLESPARLVDNQGNQNQAAVSLYLYHITPNAQLNNRPPVPVGSQLFQSPLCLDLHYLLTPLLSVPEDNLLVMGAAMQIMAAMPVVRQNFLNSQPRAGAPEVRLLLNPVTLEEMSRIWGTFNQASRLSVAYEVRGVAIDSLRGPEDGPPIVERLMDIHQIVSTEEAAP